MTQLVQHFLRANIPRPVQELRCSLWHSSKHLHHLSSPGTGSSPQRKGVLCGKLLQDEFLQPWKSGCRELPWYDRYMTFQISPLGMATLWLDYLRKHLFCAQCGQEGGGVRGQCAFRVLGAWCPPMTYRRTWSRLFDFSESVSNPSLLLGGKSSESLLFGGCMM